MVTGDNYVVIFQSYTIHCWEMSCLMFPYAQKALLVSFTLSANLLIIQLIHFNIVSMTVFYTICLDLFVFCNRQDFMNGFNLFYQTCNLLGNTPKVKNLIHELAIGTFKALGTLSNWILRSCLWWKLEPLNCREVLYVLSIMILSFEYFLKIG